MIRIKAGVDFSNTHWKIMWALFEVEPVFDANDLICVVTSLSDGTHMVGSLHGSRAIDLRSRMIRRSVGEAMAVEMRKRLGSDFDVVVHIVKNEVDHFHIEYQPKGGREHV